MDAEEEDDGDDDPPYKGIIVAIALVGRRFMMTKHLILTSHQRLVHHRQPWPIVHVLYISCLCCSFDNSVVEVSQQRFTTHWS